MMSELKWEKHGEYTEFASMGAFGLTVEPPNDFFPLEWYWTVKPRRAKYTVSGFTRTKGAAKRAALRMARFMAGQQKEER